MQEGCAATVPLYRLHAAKVSEKGDATTLTRGAGLLSVDLLPMKKVIATADAPAAVGPYSQAVAVGSTLYCAGQIPLDAATGQLVSEEIQGQTRQVLQNLGAVLRANGMDFSNVVKTTVFLTDLAEFAAMNEIYAETFAAPFPARSTIEVAGLPKGARVEIEAIAVA